MNGIKLVSWLVGWISMCDFLVVQRKKIGKNSMMKSNFFSIVYINPVVIGHSVSSRTRVTHVHTWGEDTTGKEEYTIVRREKKKKESVSIV